jgi:hypothetical protein
MVEAARKDDKYMSRCCKREFGRVCKCVFGIGI